MEKYYYTSNVFTDTSQKNAIDTIDAESFDDALRIFASRKQLPKDEFSQLYIILKSS